MPGLDQLPTQPSPADEEELPPNSRRQTLWTVAVASVSVLALLGVLVGVLAYSGPEHRSTQPSTGTDSPDPRQLRGDDGQLLGTSGAGQLDPALAGTEAAVEFGWPLIAADEFDGTALGPQWGAYTGRTTGGVGRHDPANISVRDGVMTITSHGRESAGMAWLPGQLYGRWEVRARTHAGNGYGPVILLWPDAEDWPRGGEINFLEIPGGDRTLTHFIVHFGRDNRQVGTEVEGDFTQWHTYAVEWAPDHVAGFIDGREIFRTTDRSQIPPRSMHLAIQQDIGPYGTDWIPARDATTPATVPLDVDWVRIYGL